MPPSFIAKRNEVFVCRIAFLYTALLGVFLVWFHTMICPLSARPFQDPGPEVDVTTTEYGRSISAITASSFETPADRSRASSFGFHSPVVQEDNFWLTTPDSGLLSIFKPSQHADGAEDLTQHEDGETIITGQLWNLGADVFDGWTSTTGFAKNASSELESLVAGEYSTSCIVDEQLMGTAELFKKDAETLFTYYCTNSTMDFDNLGLSCEEYSQHLVSTSPVLFPRVSDFPPMQDVSTEEKYYNVSNEIRRGLYAYYTVAQNVTQNEEYNKVCKYFLLPPGQTCDGEQVCESQPTYCPFYCSLFGKTNDVLFEIIQLINILSTRMDENDIPIIPRDLEMLPDPDDMYPRELLDYALGGTYNLLRQAVASLDGLTLMCEPTLPLMDQ